MSDCCSIGGCAVDGAGSLRRRRDGDAHTSRADSIKMFNSSEEAAPVSHACASTAQTGDVDGFSSMAAALTLQLFA